MNPELYERYLAKKAKKLGISVEELKAQGASPVTSAPVEEKPVQQDQQISEPQYIQHTIQEHLENQPYSGMQPETVKTEVPSYVFGPSRMQESKGYSSMPIQQSTRVEIKDTREGTVWKLI